MRRIIFASALLVSGLCLATVMIPLDLNQLTEKADQIVLGHCTGKRVYETGDMIWTEYTFQVYEVLKGGKVKEVKVRQPGGEIGERGIKVSGTVNFLPLEEDVLFLDKDKDGTRDVIGWSQGRFKVYYDEKTKTKYALQNLEGISFMKKTGEMEKVEPARVNLDQLKSRIKNIVDKKKEK